MNFRLQNTDRLPVNYTDEHSLLIGVSIFLVLEKWILNSASLFGTL